MLNNFKTKKIDKLDLCDMMSIEYYSMTDGNKQEGINLIKHNDMLQYHYFSQNYNILKGASIIALFVLNYKGLKSYIGFACFSSCMDNKLLRNRMYGNNFLKIIFNYQTNGLINKIKCYTLSRIVMLPSYRGLGVNKHVQTEILKHFESDPDVFFVELYSGMLHSFDFASNKFNKTLLSLKKNTAEYDEYFALHDYDGLTSKAFNRGTKYFANGVHFINPNKLNIVQLYYKDVFGLDFNINDLKNVNDDMNMNEHDIFDLVKNKIPLYLLSHFSVAELKTIKQTNIRSLYDTIQKRSHEKKMMENEEW